MSPSCGVGSVHHKRQYISKTCPHRLLSTHKRAQESGLEHEIHAFSSKESSLRVRKKQRKAFHIAHSSGWHKNHEKPVVSFVIASFRPSGIACNPKAPNEIATDASRIIALPSTHTRDSILTSSSTVSVPPLAAPRFVSSNLVHSDERSSLLLWSEPWSTNVGTSQLDAENALHVGEHLLVWSGGTVLELLNNRGGGVALGGQVLLGHLWLHLLALGRDGVTDNFADRVWLDDIVGAVDLGQMLSLDTWLGGLLRLLATIHASKAVLMLARQFCSTSPRWGRGNTVRLNLK